MFSEGQKAKLIQYLLAGLGAGAATNLTLNLVSYLKDKAADAKQSEAERKKLVSKPDVYEVDPDELDFLQKSAADSTPEFLSNSLAHALALLAGTGGLYGGYKIADLIHDKFKKDEIEEQNKAELANYYKNLYLLQKAQQSKLASEDASMKKIAMPISNVLGSALGVILLTSIGSALAARSYLQKEYPKLNIKDALRQNESLLSDSPNLPIFIERPKSSVSLDSDNPKDLNRDKNEQSINDEEEDPFSKLEKLSFEKCASYTNEALLKLCLEFEKSGLKEGSVTNLVKAASAGFVEPLKDIVDSVSYNKDLTIFDLADKLVDSYQLKTASDSAKEQIALTWLATDPSVSKAIMPQIAAEFIDHTPVISKIASEIKTTDENLFASLLMASTIKSRAEAFKDLNKKFASEVFNKNKKIFTKEAADQNEFELSDALAEILKSSNTLEETLKEIA